MDSADSYPLEVGAAPAHEAVAEARSVNHPDADDNALEQARRDLAEGRIDRLITATQARARELEYLARFDDQIRKLDQVPDPVSGHMRRVVDWSTIHQAADAAQRLRVLEPQRASSMPLDGSSAYQLPKSWRQVAMILLAQCISDLDDLSAHGFVTQATSLATLNAWLDDLCREAEVDDQIVVVSLAATAGWSEEACMHIAGGHGRAGFSHRLLVPILVDLELASEVRNPNDPRAELYVELFSGADLDARVRQAAEVLSEHMATSAYDSLDVETAIDITGHTAAVVRRTFACLADGQQFELKIIDGNDFLYRPRG
jgi:hypothetical protein